MGNDLVGDAAGIATDPGGVEANRPVKAAELWSSGRPRFWLGFAGGRRLIEALTWGRRRRRRNFGLNLPRSHFGLDQQTSAVGGDSHALPAAQPAITSDRFVMAFGIGESIRPPSQQGNPVLDSPRHNLWS